MAISQDSLSSDLSNPFVLMPIIQLSEVLHKKKGHGRLKKEEESSMSASSKTNVKRKQQEDVVTGSDLMVLGANYVGNKILCNGACSDKTNETDLVGSTKGLP